MHVVYSEAMNAPAQGASPSAAKPAAVVAAWRTTWPTLEFRAPEPVTLADFERAHTRTYIDDVFALLTAARWALAAKTAVAAPVSGFHHAGHRMGADFCTFNGLMVAALALQAERPGLRVGILDYDYHYGDGTEDIIEKKDPPGVVHVSAGEHWTRPEQAEDFLKAISTHLDAMTDCDVVLYQAGADPHMAAPEGGIIVPR